MATLTAPPRRRSLVRRVSAGLHRRPRLRLGLLLSGPAAWLVVGYLGSLAVLFAASLWRLDPFTAEVVKEVGFENFRTLWEGDVYRTISSRTILAAIGVTIIDILIAFPIAFYMARVASRRTRAVLVVLVTMPLWASYLVKAYAWRVLLAEDGAINSALAPLGISGPGYGLAAVWIVLAYLWLPYMIIPLYAGLLRIPDSLLEASADLGGKAGRTFRSVVLPLALPAVVAGSIFTFSLTLGDYIAVQVVGGRTQFIGNVVYANVGTANNLPLAAAFALVPVAVMIVYLALARRSGAFDSI